MLLPPPSDCDIRSHILQLISLTSDSEEEPADFVDSDGSKQALLSASARNQTQELLEDR